MNKIEEYGRCFLDGGSPNQAALSIARALRIIQATCPEANEDNTVFVNRGIDSFSGEVVLLKYTRDETPAEQSAREAKELQAKRDQLERLRKEVEQ